ncbi:MAG: hypothetical protein SGILL_007382, partial [Bacillariaceae sp.]
ENGEDAAFAGVHDADGVTKKEDKVLRGKILHEVREMLRMAEVDSFTDIVCWCKSGSSFKIHDRELFKEDIMKKYVSCSKLTYFSDTLRSWGFCRLKQGKGDEHNSYYHRLFRRDRPELCRGLTKDQMFASMKEFREEQKRINGSLPLLDNDVEKGNDDEEEGTSGLPDVNGAGLALLNDESPTDGSISNSHGFQGNSASLSLPSNAEPAVEKNSPEAEGDSEPLFLLQGQNSIDPINCLGNYPAGNFFDSAFQASDQIDEAISVSIERKERATTANVEGILPEKRKIKSYLCSIQSMLDDAEPKGWASTVSWMPHGRAFKIHDSKRFEKVILPQYFNGKLLSFNRHLLAWGFLRLTAGKDRGAWFHRFFVRGATELVQDFTRQEMFDATTEWIAPGKEPDFYSCGKGEALLEQLVARKNSHLEDKQDVSNEKPITDGNSPVATKECAAETDNKEVEERADQKKLRGSMIEDIREMLEIARKERSEKIARKERSEKVVGWLPHGKAFKVHNRELFIKDLLPRFSKVTKFENFADALRAWGFVKLKQNRDKGAFYHKLFQKDHPHLTLHLSRKQMKKAMTDWKSSDGTEPDLYEGISEDVLLAGEAMHALKGKKKRKRRKLPTSKGSKKRAVTKTHVPKTMTV